MPSANPLQAFLLLVYGLKLIRALVSRIQQSESTEIGEYWYQLWPSLSANRKPISGRSSEPIRQCTGLSQRWLWSWLFSHQAAALAQLHQILVLRMMSVLQNTNRD
jgi:hypothetical protein